MPFWAVVTTQPNSEARATRWLGRQGFTCYVPMTVCPLCGGGTRMRPLFGRYMFVQIVDHWYTIRSTYGVSSLLMDGAAPKHVPDKFIAELRKRETRDGYIELPKPQRFTHGQRVAITHGPFAGWYGLYDGMATEQRESVLLNLLGAWVPTELNSCDLRAA